MWIYLVVFVSAVVADGVPIIMPSAWMLMAFLMMTFHLPLLPVLLAGVSGSTLARYLHSRYMPEFSGKFLKRRKHNDLEFLGKKLEQHGWRAWLFIFVYTMSPLPHTVLFTTAGIAKVSPLQTLVPFFCAKLLRDAVLLLAVQYTVGSFRAFRHGTAPKVAILTGIIGFLVLNALLFINWRVLLDQNKVQWRFKFWK